MDALEARECGLGGVQADAGAQAVQIFDSWASHLAPQDFDVFAGPYIKQIIDDVKKTHPDLPIILYISGGSPSHFNWARSEWFHDMLHPSM